MIRALFERTVAAICATIAEEHGRPPGPAVRFVLAQHGRMTDWLRAPMIIATLVFDLGGIVHGGTLFHRASPAARRRQVEAWRRSRLGFRRDIVRFYESLSTLALLGGGAA